MSKKKLKKEIKRLNKIIDVLLKENRGIVSPLDNLTGGNESPAYRPNTTTTFDYIGGRPKDRIV